MKLALDVWVLKHLVDLFGVQTATALFLGVFVAMLGIHTTNDVVQKIPLRITRAASAAFMTWNDFVQGELWDNDYLLLFLDRFRVPEGRLDERCGWDCSMVMGIFQRW
jgi:hypothetical protein